MPRNSHEGNALPIVVLIIVLVPALLIVGVAIVVGIINDPGPLPPAPARSLEERDRQDRAKEEAGKSPIGGAYSRSSAVPRASKPDAPTQFRESVKKARERLNSSP